MCPTILGRTQTRTLILIGPAILGLLISLGTGNEGWIVLIGVYLVLGTVLDTAIYPYTLRWQPPWMTFVLAIFEFILLYLLAKTLEVGLSNFDAIWFYWVSWWMANWTKVVILPILSLTYVEDGGEMRRADWTIPAELQPLPVVALPDQPGELVREFSSVHQIPAELRDLPAPSGVRRTVQPPF